MYLGPKTYGYTHEGCKLKGCDVQRTKTKANYGSDPLNEGGSLARLFRIGDLLPFLDFDGLCMISMKVYIKSEFDVNWFYCNFTSLLIRF